MSNHDSSVIDGNQKYLVGTQGEIARQAEQAQRDFRASQIASPRAGVLVERMPDQIQAGRFQIKREDTGEVLYEDHNIITNTVKWLFAYLMANYTPGETFTPQQPYQQGQAQGPLYGIWGLALGTGSPTWAPQTQPAETPTQTALISQVLRKPLSSINYVDANFNPLGKFTLQVDFQTVINATTDNLIGVGIREMGLIGGGTFNGPTNMLTAPYFNPLDTSGPGGGPSVNSVILINYKTLPPLILPSGVNIIISWVLSF
jgi:hypothetical protein